VKLLNTFSKILLIDNTYKSIDLEYILVDIIGVTFIMLTFFMTFVLLAHK